MASGLDYLRFMNRGRSSMIAMLGLLGSMGSSIFGMGMGGAVRTSRGGVRGGDAGIPKF